MVQRSRTNSGTFVVFVDEVGKLRRAMLQKPPEPLVPRDARQDMEVYISRQNRFRAAVVVVVSAYVDDRPSCLPLFR